jgi:hypothetical protein
MTEQNIKEMTLQQIKYLLTIRGDQRKRLTQEISEIDATVLKLKERQSELLSERFKDVPVGDRGGCHE